MSSGVQDVIPGTFSWIFQDLESPGKVSLKVVHFCSGSNGKQAAIVYTILFSTPCLIKNSAKNVLVTNSSNVYQLWYTDSAKARFVSCALIFTSPN